MSKIQKEIEVGKLMVDYFIEREWEVYQEVRFLDHTCDLIAISGKFSWAIECKLSNFFKLMSQAKRWLGYFSFVSIAYPWQKRNHDEHALAYEICKYLGIGLFGVRDGSVIEIFRPKFYRRLHEMGPYLDKAQQNFISAGSKGGYWSPFKQTCESLRWFVKGHPGYSMKEAMFGIKHHYSSDITARSAMFHWLHAGKVKGVHIRKDNKKLFLYPEEEQGKQP